MAFTGLIEPGINVIANVELRPKLAVPGKKKAAYLEQHKLLSDDERESLPADAFDPVAYVPTD